MRLPSVRFTVRRMMVAVAFFGLVLASAIEAQRRREGFLRIADFHERQSPYSYPGYYPVPIRPMSEWHEQMGRKYHRAASRPWLPVEPDPPEPK